MMSYAATSPELSFLNDNNLIWRTCPSNQTGGTISAQYCYDSLLLQKAAILYRNDRFGKGLSEVIKNSFQQAEGTVISLGFPADKKELLSYNLTNDLNKIFKEQVDVVYIIGFSADKLVIANGIYNNALYQSLKEKPILFVNDGTVANDLINNLNSVIPKEIANYLWEVSGSDMLDSTDQAEQFLINVNEFDIAKQLIGRGNTINYDGASGPINFDYNGDPHPKITIWGIENSEYVEISYYD